MFRLQLLQKISLAVGLLVIASCIVLLQPKTARAYVDNMDTNPPSRASNSSGTSECSARVGYSWGVGVTVNVELYDENGNYAGNASNYTFDIQSNEFAAIRVGASVSTDPGNPTIGGQVFRHGQLTKDADNDRIAAFGGACAGSPYVIDSRYYNDGTTSLGVGADDVMLDCLGGDSRAAFTFSGTRINQSQWESGYFESSWTITPGDNLVDLNDSLFNVTLRYHRTRAQGIFSTQKYYPANHSYGVNTLPTIPDLVKNAPVHYSNANGEFANISANPASGTLWVDYLSPFTNYARFPGYTVSVEVPPSYRVKRWEIASVGGYYDNRVVHNASDSTITGIYVKNGSTTWLDFFFERIPSSNLETIDCNKNGVVTGWVQIPNDSGGVQGAEVDLYIDKTAGPGVQPDAKLTTTSAEQYAGEPVYRFSYAIPNNLKDGNNHTVHAHSFLANGTPFELSGSPKNFQCKALPKYYPWLQTQKGDVISLGNILGQEVGNLSNPTMFPGARQGTSGSKNTPFTGAPYPLGTMQNPESYFVIAQGKDDKGATNDFCSAHLYTLGSPQNTNKESCGLTGQYSMTGVNMGAIAETLQTVWAQNGAGNNTTCSPYRTFKLASSITDINYFLKKDLTLGCAGGGIQYFEGAGAYNLAGFFSSDIPVSGRGTLWVKGNLNILANIKYQNPALFTDPKSLPNFAIFVDGDVTIDKEVTQIDAMIIATGKINTCSQGNEDTPTCRKRLIVNGLIASDGKIDFARRWFDKGIPNVNSAENIILTGQSIILPPPGLDKRDSTIDSSLQINSGELPPRLN